MKFNKTQKNNMQKVENAVQDLYCSIIKSADLIIELNYQ